MKKNQNPLRERINFELAIQFVLFLSENSCLSNYSKYIRSVHGCSVGHFLYATDPKYWVSGPFAFYSVEKGYDLWIEINEKWNIVLHEFCL